MGRPKKDLKRQIHSVNIALLQEIVNLLGETDKKAVLMQESIKNDFSSLKKHLNQQSPKLKTISETILELDELFRKSNFKNLSNTITEFQKFVASKSESINKRFKLHISLAEEMKTKAEFIQVPLKTYKQNVADLKTLISKFRKNTIKSGENLLPDSAYELQDSYFSRMENLFVSFEDALDKTKKLLAALIKGLAEHDKSMLDKFSALLHRLALNNIEITSLYDDKTSVFPGLKEKTCLIQASNAGISKNLKNEDIILQRIRHINKIQTSLISELKTASKTDEFHIPLAEYKLAFKMPDLAELQAAQLIFNNQEYKNVVEKTGTSFTEIAQNIGYCSDDCSFFSRSCQKIENEMMKELQLRLNEFAATFDHFMNFKKKYGKDLKSLDKLSDELFNNLTLLNGLNANIEQITFNALRKNSGSSNQKETTAFMKKIQTILTDNNVELHSIQQLFTTIQKNAKFLVLSIDNTRADVLMLKVNNQFYEAVSRNFKTIAKDFPAIKKLLQKTIEQCKSVSKEIVPLPVSSAYLDTFNTASEDLVFNLNHIHKQLISENININQFRQDINQKQKKRAGLPPTINPYQNPTLNKLKGKSFINNNLFLKPKREKHST
jgi:hypothetical protein